MGFGYSDKNFDKVEADKKLSIPPRLPATIEAELFTQEQAMFAMAAQENPVKNSIIKWRQISSFIEKYKDRGVTLNANYIASLHHYIGFKTCTMCLDAVNKLKEAQGSAISAEEKCRYCLLGKFDKCLNEDSTFSRFEKTLKKSWDIQNTWQHKDKKKAVVTELLKLAKKMELNMHRFYHG